mgnify:FL=1
MDMPTKRIVQDPDFGRIEIRTNRRARNITMRPKDDGLHVTVPPYTSLASVLKAIEPHRQTLREGCEKLRPRLIDLDFTIDAPCFKLCVASGSRQFFSVRFDDDKATVFCPPDTQFSRPEVQKLLSAAVVRAMKRRAQQFLPPLLAELASMHGLTYKKVRVTGARSKWGSCTSAGTINLSCYLMLLPPHLMDYVLLHELAHTREMNHGQQFYALLNSMTDGMALQLRSQLRAFRTSF